MKSCMSYHFFSFLFFPFSFFNRFGVKFDFCMKIEKVKKQDPIKALQMCCCNESLRYCSSATANLFSLVLSLFTFCHIGTSKSMQKVCYK